MDTRGTGETGVVGGLIGGPSVKNGIAVSITAAQIVVLGRTMLHSVIVAVVSIIAKNTSEIFHQNALPMIAPTKGGIMGKQRNSMGISGFHESQLLL